MKETVVSGRFSDAELQALEKLPGASRSEKLKNAVLHQQVTAAIAAAVAAEIRKATEPTRALLDEVKQLRNDVATFDRQTKETERRAAEAVRTSLEVAATLDKKMSERERALERKLQEAHQEIARKQEQTKRFAQAVMDKIGGR